MKKTLALILAAALVLSCLASCSPNDTADGSSKSNSSKDKVSSGLVASGDASSGDESSDESATSSGLISEIISSLMPSSNGSGTSSGNPHSSTATSSKPNSSSSSASSSVTADGYIDIDAEVARRGLNKSSDISVCFQEGAKGYIINGGPYKVDEATLVRLTKSEVKGNGSVKWKSFSKMGSSTGNKDPFEGVVPVSKLKDPVFMSTALPSELQTYMTARINATNMYEKDTKFKKLVAIGAIYKEKNTILPDNAEITVCLGKITLLARTEQKGWFAANVMAHPAAPDKIYPLPWSLEHTLGATSIPSNRIKTYSDHVEIKLTGAMLNGTYNVPAGYKDQVEGSVLHFWGNNWTFTDGSKVQGCVAGYVAWIKEPQYVGKVVAAVGADWRTSNNEISQAFSGMNYKLTTEPRLVFGHNVGPKAYDEIMDTEKVQQLLGLK